MVAIIARSGAHYRAVSGRGCRGGAVGTATAVWRLWLGASRRSLLADPFSRPSCVALQPRAAGPAASPAVCLTIATLLASTFAERPLRHGLRDPGGRRSWLPTSMTRWSATACTADDPAAGLAGPSSAPDGPARQFAADRGHGRHLRPDHVACGTRFCSAIRGAPIQHGLEADAANASLPVRQCRGRVANSSLKRAKGSGRGGNTAKSQFPGDLTRSARR